MSDTPYHCPDHGLPLAPADGGYACPEGCAFPVVASIPRFVDSSNYARSFGLQWNRFRTTQLDSHTGTTISRDRLTRLTFASGGFDVVTDYYRHRRSTDETRRAQDENGLAPLRGVRGQRRRGHGPEAVGTPCTG